ncbi:hypothetical protein BHE74_00018575 [Ensete ventricosum]|nr:hypothetical protein BHE74_00018575 [Ensete ventricosum]
MEMLELPQQQQQQRHHRIKVNLTNSRSSLASFGCDLKETFLPDDPFRDLKHQSGCGAACSLVKYFVPMLEWAPRYTLGKFRSDLLAGITIATLAIPQGISYARLANLPPVVGLFLPIHLVDFLPLYSQWRWESVLVGVCFIGFLFLCKYVVGPLKKGLNPISITHLKFQSKYLSVLLKAGLVSGFLALSVGLSVIRALLYVARPNTCKLGNIAGTDMFRDIEQYPDCVGIPNMLILKMSSPVYYANASYSRER